MPQFDIKLDRATGEWCVFYVRGTGPVLNWLKSSKTPRKCFPKKEEAEKWANMAKLRGFILGV